MFSVLQQLGPLGLRIIVMGRSDSKKETTMGDLLALFRALKPHSRMNFLVMTELLQGVDREALRGLYCIQLEKELLKGALLCLPSC